MTKLEIVTERLTLRLIKSSDLNSVHELHSFPEVDAYNTLGIPTNISETNKIVQGWIADQQQSEIENYIFAIEHTSNGEFIGLFGFKLGNKKYKRAEIWYKIHPKFWKKGFATEAVKAILDFGFETLKLHRIEAGCSVHNIGSIKVLEKVGMIREGRGREVLPLKSGWSDCFEYSILEMDERK
ncbi:GNAT family N-acetyltransferase [Kordia sp. YSTF-M3]|uniref:GNAT family N-acetyltransferase n=1 Tax=Kordia aestuariivivens TaxID=2759037 RepID=A0ABR7Q955_9FLAO|nr:GNAT family N-acetyltransferase [Kordia aestuariivivens]MBC8755094.1 GNAT family N-acetyltransferase [Kordia aestuariivivens]